MCGRFTLTTEIDPESLAELFQAAPALRVLRRRFNIAPTQPAPAVLAHGGRRVLTSLHWGLIPHWSRTPRRLINARAETVTNTPAFKEPFRQRRCLIPSDGFFEWAISGDRKQPYWLHRADLGVFAFAGLYDRWRTPKGELMDTFTIITTTPNRVVKQVHNRMPVILDQEAYDQWLSPTTSPDALRGLLRPASDDLLVGTPVSSLVNDPAHDTDECIQPLDGAPKLSA